MKRSVIIGHRKRLGLCTRCGMEPHIDTECIEIYNKASNVIKPIEINLKPNLSKKTKAIITYRRKKLLCERCGMEQHNGTCIEEYNKADNRSQEEKNFRPAIISTPKDKPTLIIDELKETINSNITIQTNIPSDIAKIKLQREFIVLNVNPSDAGDIVEFSCITQLNKKYCDYIICIIGDVDKYLPYAQLLKFKKLTNFLILKNDSKSEIINYLHSCKLFLSFKNEYTHYSIKNSIPVYIFEEGKNATNFLKESAYLK